MDFPLNPDYTIFYQIEVAPSAIAEICQNPNFFLEVVKLLEKVYRSVVLNFFCFIP
jgi:hypothetical protein